MRIVGLPEFGSSVRRPSAAVSPAEKITPSQEVAAREVPVDHDRVAEIRKALEDGTYPLIPTEIADAIIASRLYGKVG